MSAIPHQCIVKDYGKTGCTDRPRLINRTQTPKTEVVAHGLFPCDFVVGKAAPGIQFLLTIHYIQARWLYTCAIGQYFTKDTCDSDSTESQNTMGAV